MTLCAAEVHVGPHCDPLDPLVVIADEAKMSRHRAQAFPAGEGRDLDDDPGELPVGLDVRIDRLRELREVLLLEGRLRLQVEDGIGSVEAEVDHGVPSMTRDRRYYGTRITFPRDSPPIIRRKASCTSSSG